MNEKTIFVGDAPLKLTEKVVRGGYVTLLGEQFYKIHNFDALEPFFMSIVSSSDHWLFISSTGGLTAGRGSAEQALFPYYNEDRVTENNENTGAKAILLARRSGDWRLWEPFSLRQAGLYRLQRNLYKNKTGTALVFEEANLDLELTYRYAWRTSETYGFVKTVWLNNNGSSTCEIELVDGLQNLLPANVTSLFQNTFSVLLDAYKTSQLEPETGLGIFTLSSNPTDQAEPSECLRATTVAQVGLQPVGYLLSSLQLDRFRRGEPIQPEMVVNGRRAAYLVHANLQLEAGGQRSWHLLADVDQDYAAVVRLLKVLKADGDHLYQAVEADMAANQEKLLKIVASADGLQLTQSLLATSHHFANVLFNVMRGGVFAEHYWVHAHDLREFVAVHSPVLLDEQADFFARLPARIQVADLQARADASASPDLARLCATYLPLTFSRRHGDPSRPWNRFSINVKKPDGSQRLDYEGNWRDIFQNWEALAWSYPEFVEGMLHVFLNATTLDGYNPYRITRAGIDWEQPDPHSPWANIGYWSDHQIIYLLKLMETSARLHPGRLQHYLDRPVFSYANVPYRLKPYADLLQDPYNTIDFDWELQRAIEARVREEGTDARLVSGPDGQPLHVSLAEKLLTLLLAKLANFVPEGGIWMNTQRPEWNDANNALVGKGLSVVTLCYLRRCLVFCRELFASAGSQTVTMQQEVAAFYARVADILARFRPVLSVRFNDAQRREMLDTLGQAGSDYRWDYYQHGLSGEAAAVPVRHIEQFFGLALEYVEHSLRANQRPDHLYHAYNILHLSEGRAAVGYLYEMLEGQVAILSSGLLSSEQALALLRSLRAGPLYRADQHSYILYPDHPLPGFLEKNCIRPEQVRRLRLFPALAAAGDKSLVVQDDDGSYHFSGRIRNVKDVDRALSELQAQPAFAELASAETGKIRDLFEEIFHHQQFIGRAGTFFAYEGLGSIYWHMVTKLLLAVQEVAQKAQRDAPEAALSRDLSEIYQDIRQGLGFHKSPQVYGAFPTDPYSHTPKGRGAQQPGMTGQVKEEILARMAELGLCIQAGRLCFDPFLLDPEELLAAPAVFQWLDVAGQFQSLELPPGSLAYTFCQVPIILQAAHEDSLEVHRSDGAVQTHSGQALEAADSQHIFQRDGHIHHLRVHYTSKNRILD
ncbi:MAG: hypothetical protein AB1894_13485 [Chloroflexota bacterium]